MLTFDISTYTLAQLQQQTIWCVVETALVSGTIWGYEMFEDSYRVRVQTDSSGAFWVTAEDCYDTYEDAYSALEIVVNQILADAQSQNPSS